MKALSLCLLIFLTACSTTETKSLTGRRDPFRLFPNGRYQHQVTLSLPSDKKMDFIGVVKLEDKLIQIAGLTQFGLTAFKIQDDLTTHQVQVEIFIEAMKKHEPKVREYYSVLKHLLTNRQALEIQKNLTWKKDGVDFKFRSFDSQNIPEVILIEHAKFSVTLQVTQYEI